MFYYRQQKKGNERINLHKMVFTTIYIVATTHRMGVQRNSWIQMALIWTEWCGDLGRDLGMAYM
jgi:hypothetical protein